MPQGTSAQAPTATAANAVAAALYAKLEELSAQYEQDWLDAGCPSGNGEGSYSSAASHKLFAETFGPALEWLEKNRDVEFWNEFRDLYKFWDSAICSGDIMMLFDFIDIERIYEPSAPATSDEALDAPPTELFYLCWQHHDLGADPTVNWVYQSNTRIAKSQEEVAHEMMQYIGTEYPGWKREGRLDYWCIYDRTGKELFLDELEPMTLTRRQRLRMDDIGRIDKLAISLTDDAFPLRIEFYQEEDEYDDSLLIVLNIASEQSRKEYRKNAIEEFNEGRDYDDYDDSHDW
jgi:hypothetical protein